MTFQVGDKVFITDKAIDYFGGNFKRHRGEVFEIKEFRDIVNVYHDEKIEVLRLYHLVDSDGNDLFVKFYDDEIEVFSNKKLLIIEDKEYASLFE